ncbi:branched-chain amino acid ABC transporter permease [Tuanshanicoccus lijuaniae]|uniref:branched-chain amino acid ABC transporter permease n=1 Tax=Aerococcaceae bacterium zg-1292 TaxID=2774330 RepID=UPI001BD84AC8|nr:branched-chain amino acid ABC transporter permease [Aerococcaceae bacterium zg-A91]MBS4457133.1 branched-chain amino acid ABC transporter permease [Aerococcaceae bacterium zg-BR33]
MFITQLINGLTLGLTYALIAVGYSLVFGILRLVNFSYGSIYAFGANIIIFMIAKDFGLFPAVLISILITGIVNVLIDKVALEPLRNQNAPSIASLITTIGVSNVITNLLIVFFSSEKKSFPSIFPFGSVQLGNIFVTYTQIGMLIISLLLLTFLIYIVYKTKIGLGMRATEQNAKAALLMGVDVNKVIKTTFLLAGMSAAIAGTLVASYYNMAYPNMGAVSGLKAFAAAVLGGIGNLPGSIIGGLSVGIFEVVAATVLGSEYRDSVAFIILIVVLLIRPQGIFGKKGIYKV